MNSSNKELFLHAMNGWGPQKYNPLHRVRELLAMQWVGYPSKKGGGGGRGD